MINCDAWLKSIWHGVFMAREKRAKFVDRWRLIAEPSITRSVAYEFEAAGMQIEMNDAYLINKYHF